MSFNKRFFSIDLLVNFYINYEELAIEKAIGKIDGFIFRDEESHRIIDLWVNDKKEESIKMLKDYVRRVTP